MKNNKTKIIATLGPSCSSYESILRLIISGVDVFRINLSHSKSNEVKQYYEWILSANEELHCNVAILADLQGPKLRVGEMPEEGILLQDGQSIIITNEEILGNTDKFTLRYDKMAEELMPGDRILIDDGKLELKITETLSQQAISAKVIHGGLLKSRKGFNAPNSSLSVSAITGNDAKFVEQCCQLGVDWFALSFVRNADDVIQLKELIKKYGVEIPVIAKIEKPDAVKHIEGIIDAADAIMVARGDLGIEMPIHTLPGVQKSIVSKTRAKAKPVIVATQMMESMINSSIPTRAEVTDVANAVMDGADAVMLSGETSVGIHPELVVKTMDLIIRDVEKEYEWRELMEKKNDHCLSVQKQICQTAAELSKKLNAIAITSMTFTGSSVLRIASYRPKASVYAFSSNRNLLRRLNLVWGVNVYYYNNVDNTDKNLKDVIDILRAESLVKSGDKVIQTASMPLSERLPVNTIKISEV